MEYLKLLFGPFWQSLEMNSLRQSMNELIKDKVTYTCEVSMLESWDVRGRVNLELIIPTLTRDLNLMAVIEGATRE